ncbi:hypothetical protein OTU49_000127, partial [Cherax quadricarinatus]
MKKPFFWKLGYLKLNRKAKLSGVSGVETEVTVGSCCVPLPDDTTDGPLSLTSFRGELDSAVSQYISQVKDLGYKEEGIRDQKLLAVKFQLDPDDIKPKSEEIEEIQPKLNVISKEDKSEQTDFEEEVLSVDNPLYLTLSECSSGLLSHTDHHLSHDHHYENGHIGKEDEHIYENVGNSRRGEGEEEEHLYDSLPRRKPDLPPKPDFLSQLAARQSEPVKRAWNPFVSLSVDTGDPTPPLSTASSLSPPDSNLSNEHSEVSSHKLTDKTIINPFLISRSKETCEETLILDGSETSDLGSSGGEYDVEDWPLPPTPPPGEEEVSVHDDPLPPPPPELALQQLEEEVFREAEEERKLTFQKEKGAIGCNYSAKTLTLDEEQKIEAVNINLPSLEKFKKPVIETSVTDSKPKKPKIIQVDEDDSEEFDTPAIRHSVIIELKDSCPSVPQSIRPSDIRRKESLKRSESVRHTGVLRRTNSYNKVSRRESLSDVFPSIKGEFKKSDVGDSIPVGVTSPKKEPSLSSLGNSDSNTDQVIEISEDGFWETKSTSMDSLSSNPKTQGDNDPYTGNPVIVPQLNAAAIAAPPKQFQVNDGMDGVYSANVINTHSGPSSIASTFADTTTVGDVNPPETPTLLITPETIHEEPTVSQNSREIGQETKDSESDLVLKTEDNDVRSPSHKNLGVAIMEGYAYDLQKKKDSMNLPEHSLLEFGDSVRDLEEQRRSVIKQMTVKAKRKDTWIKTFSMHDQGKENIPVAPSRSRRKNSPVRPQIVTNPGENSQDATDSPVIKPTRKSEAGIVKSQKSNFEASVLQQSSSKTTKAPTVVVEPASPPDASHSDKKTVQLEPAIAMGAAKNENVAEENIITPKNTEMLAALFSSSNKAAGNNEELKESTQGFPKKLEACIETEEVRASLEGPQTPVVDPILVDEPVFLAEAYPVELVASPTIINIDEALLMKTHAPHVTTTLDLTHIMPSEPHFQSALTKENEEEQEEEESPMVREKNEINLAYSTLAKFLSTELTEHKQESIIAEEKKMEQSEMRAFEETEQKDPNTTEEEMEQKKETKTLKEEETESIEMAENLQQHIE